MTYDLLVLVHVLAAIVWIGAGLMMLLLSTMADRAGDADTFGALVALNTRLGLRLFVPASLLVLVAGLLAVAAGPWSLGALWLVLALAGFATTFLMGGLVFKPVRCEGSRRSGSRRFGAIGGGCWKFSTLVC